MSYGYGYRYGSKRLASGPPSITSSDGDTASLIDNGNGTYGVVIGGSTVGTITQAQINAGGFITVVEPVVGMSGNNVVLTTTGYVIYVGSTPIETDIEVLADGAVVGTVLPFDATSYPDVSLTVRFLFGAGGATLTITKQARAAVQKIIQFRDTNLDLAVAAGTPWISNRTRQMTLALRIIGNFNTSTDISTNIGIVSLTGVQISNNRFSGTPLQIASRSSSPLETFNPIHSGAAGTAQSIALLAAVDYDGGLPGGEKFVLWMSRNGGAWARILGHSVGPADARLAFMTSFGSQNAGTQGGSFDISNHLWAANVALDPATNWPNFFNADGTVKDLGASGVVAGVTPLIYMIGNDFVTGANRGSGGGTAVRTRTPAVVINA